MSSTTTTSSDEVSSSLTEITTSSAPYYFDNSRLDLRKGSFGLIWLAGNGELESKIKARAYRSQINNFDINAKFEEIIDKDVGIVPNPTDPAETVGLRKYGILVHGLVTVLCLKTDNWLRDAILFIGNQPKNNKRASSEELIGVEEAIDAVCQAYINMQISPGTSRSGSVGSAVNDSRIEELVDSEMSSRELTPQFEQVNVVQRRKRPRRHLTDSQFLQILEVDLPAAQDLLPDFEPVTVDFMREMMDMDEDTNTIVADESSTLTGQEGFVASPPHAGDPEAQRRTNERTPSPPPLVLGAIVNPVVPRPRRRKFFTRGCKTPVFSDVETQLPLAVMQAEIKKARTVTLNDLMQQLPGTRFKIPDHPQLNLRNPGPGRKMVGVRLGNLVKEMQRKLAQRKDDAMRIAPDASTNRPVSAENRGETPRADVAPDYAPNVNGTEAENDQIPASPSNREEIDISAILTPGHVAGDGVAAAGDDFSAAGIDVNVGGDDMAAAGDDVNVGGDDFAAAGIDVNAGGDDMAAAGDGVAAGGEKNLPSFESLVPPGSTKLKACRMFMGFLQQQKKKNVELVQQPLTENEQGPEGYHPIFIRDLRKSK